MVLLSGTVFTGRDEVHKYLHKGGDLPVLQRRRHLPLRPGRAGGGRHVPCRGRRADHVDPRGAVPGRRDQALRHQGGDRQGRHGAKTLEACREHGCVYLHAIGGAAQIYARCVESVANVYLKQFGSPEAVWEMRVKDFPAVVTMDAHGRSLHQEVADASKGEAAGRAGRKVTRRSPQASSRFANAHFSKASFRPFRH